MRCPSQRRSIRPAMMARVAGPARTCIEANERLLAATRYRLAVARRLLCHPHFTLEGGSGDTDAQSVRATVRTLLASGALWPIHGGVQWAGYGSGKPCYVCGSPISRAEVEYEVDDGGLKLSACHFACFAAWHEESQTFDGYDGRSMP